MKLSELLNQRRALLGLAAGAGSPGPECLSFAQLDSLTDNPEAHAHLRRCARCRTLVELMKKAKAEEAAAGAEVLPEQPKASSRPAKE